MAKENDTTLNQCCNLFRYDADTGKLFWRHRNDVFARWNTRYAGKETFLETSNGGYKVSRPFRSFKDTRWFFAHRVAWAITHGQWPEGFIDHIDGDRSNNRLANLRVVSASVNQRNKNKPINNVSGFSGVSFHSRDKIWRAHVQIGNKSKHLGSFATKDEAIAVRLAYNAKHQFTERHGA